jgi:hypothetical protein
MTDLEVERQAINHDPVSETRWVTQRLSHLRVDAIDHDPSSYPDRHGCVSKAVESFRISPTS